MLTYSLAVASLNARGAELSVRRKFDLEHMRTLARALGNPQQQFRSVLIAGTNGKGSTAATLAAIATVAGIRTGLYTSPHLSRVNERICIRASDKPLQPISDEQFAAAFARVDEASEALVRDGKLPHLPSFFETVTAMAFCAFADAQVELAVLEVGMGGRLDATNIVEPLLSILTDIDLDHTEWLGDTLEQIAREKAGILREHGTLITLPQHPKVNQAIGEEAMRLNVNGVNAAGYIPVRATSSSFGNAYSVQVEDETLQVRSPLSGQHQQRNLALAIAAAVELKKQHQYKISRGDIEQGIQATVWPGRLERFSHSPEILLDVAHNAAGAWTLRAALSALEEERPARARTLLFGCLADKPLEQFVQILFTVFNGPRDRVILTRPGSPRAADPSELALLAAKAGIHAVVQPDPKDALAEALRMTAPDGLIVIAGSVFLVGELRPLLSGQK